MEGLGRFLRTITSIDVEVDRDGGRNRSNAFLVRVSVMTSGPVFRSKVVCDDPMEGIDVAVERLSRRLKEFKRRRSGRPLHSRPKTAVLGTSGGTSVSVPGDTSGSSTDEQLSGLIDAADAE
jgi:ribosomal subunit interface protein